MNVLNIKEKHLGLRIENEVHAKLKYIANGEGRSMNGQITYLIKQCINEYEKTNGKIEVLEDKE